MRSTKGLPRLKNMTSKMQLRKMRNGQAGFTMIELCFVLAIILVLAAIATPRWLRARDAAKEASAAATVRTINSAEQMYSITYGMGYTTLSNLGGGANCKATPTSACLIDEKLASGHRGDYSFDVKLVGAIPSLGSDFGNSYTIAATPDAQAKSGPTICANPFGPAGQCGNDSSSAAAAIVRQSGSTQN